ncbi:PadR family transcriptional regulator, partial [Nocardioides sp.]|uniref:PadR family transcriptional regulator n=1 Tax=Nocardioides sp. TaxID=35761 RepID=UPI002734E5FE
TLSRMTGRDVGASRETLLMRGVLDMCVLAILEGEPLHAYGLVQRLQECGFSAVSYGTVYPLVTRLKKQGLVDQTLEESPSGPARNVLQVNRSGRTALRLWSEQWHRTTEITRRALSASQETRGNENHVS